MLSAADRALTAHEIRLETERLLGSPVSRHSIGYELQTKSKCSKPTIVQTKRRYYRLAEVVPTLAD